MYGELESLMSHPDAVNEVLLKRDLVGTIDGSEERKCLEESFAIQLDRRRNFIAKVNHRSTF